MNVISFYWTLSIYVYFHVCRSNNWLFKISNLKKSLHTIFESNPLWPQPPFPTFHFFLFSFNLFWSKLSLHCLVCLSKELSDWSDKSQFKGKTNCITFTILDAASLYCIPLLSFTINWSSLLINSPLKCKSCR